jgi:hypothetical protein
MNRITATAEVHPPLEQEDAPTTVTRASVAVTRVRGSDTGPLNLATALWVAADHREVYWICGEGDGCSVRPVCVRISRVRIDCPVAAQVSPRRPRVCGTVISVHLRGRRIFSYPYRCEGAWRGNSRSFVRACVQRIGRRYRIDERQAEWLASEVNDPNRYGVPRFDARRDVFIP